jgi:hypothetical protein
VVDQQDERRVAVLRRQPLELAVADASEGMVDGDRFSVDAKGSPRPRYRVEHRDAPATRKGLGEWRWGGDAFGSRLDHSVEAPFAGGDQRRGIPETQHEPPQVSGPARMATARRKIMVAVQHGQPIRVKQSPIRKGVEHEREQRPVPSVQQIARDRKMDGFSRHDAIELPFQRGHIGSISDVEIRQMRNQHMSV